MRKGPNGRLLAYRWDMMLHSHIKQLVKSKLGHELEQGFKLPLFIPQSMFQKIVKNIFEEPTRGH